MATPKTIVETFGYIENKDFREALVDAVEAINKLQLWEWIRFHEHCYSCDEYDLIEREMRVSHTVSSLWTILKLMHFIAYEGMDDFKSWIQVNHEIWH